MKTIYQIQKSIRIPLMFLLLPTSLFGQGISVSSGASIKVSGAAVIKIDNGNFVNNGTYTKGSENVTLSGNSAKEMSGSSITSLNNLAITNTGGITTKLSQLTANAITIASGSKFTIETEKAVIVSTTLTNNEGTNGLLIKSSSENANGSLVFAIPANNQTVPASVEMYSKSYWDSQYHWQYFGIPVQSTTVGTTFNVSGNRVRKYDEGNVDVNHLDIGLWKPSGAGKTMLPAENLIPIDGYEVVKPSASTYTFRGNLFVSDINKVLSYTSGADWAGNNIYANPFTAAIDIKEISFGSGTLAAVYLYNTGSREEWSVNSLLATPGTYDVSTIATAGEIGVPSQIPSMQGFLVRTLNLNNTDATFGYACSKLIKNAEKQRVRNSLKVGTRIDVIGTSSADKMWIFSDAGCTHSFDNGWDGEKMIMPGVTQLYALEEDGNYQINAVNDINNVNLGFKPASNGVYKLRFTHQNTGDLYNKIYLVDNIKNLVYDITTDGSEYVFDATTSDNLSRFKIITSTTDDEIYMLNSPIKVFGSKGSLFVENRSHNPGDIVLYTLSGVESVKVPFNPDGITTINNIQPGIYISKAIIGTDKFIERIIIN